jgi:hypothetical protein
VRLFEFITKLYTSSVFLIFQNQKNCPFRFLLISQGQTIASSGILKKTSTNQRTTESNYIKNLKKRTHGFHEEPLKHRPFYIGISALCLIFSKVLFLSPFAHLIGLKAARPQRYADRVLLVFFPYNGKDIVFRFIIEYSSLRDFSP